MYSSIGLTNTTCKKDGVNYEQGRKSVASRTS
jgi:hypothetical protein